MALTALAGPMSNIIAALIAAIGLNSLIYFGRSTIPYDALSYIISFIYSFVKINIGLAVFNLLPLPPLDGSKILAAFLPNKFLFKYYQYERYIIFAVFFLLFTNILLIPLILLQNLVLSGIIWLAALPFGI